MLLRDARIGDMVVNPADKSIWGIRHQNGFATIVRIPPPYAGFNQVHTFDYGADPVRSRHLARRLDDLRLVWRDRRQAIGPGLEAAELQAGSGPRKSPGSTCRRRRPKASSSRPTAKRLYGTSYYTGVSNVFRFDIATQKYEAVSNASTGFFRPMPQADGSLIAYEFAGEGLTAGALHAASRARTSARSISSAPRSSPRIPSSSHGASARRPRSPLDELITERGKYSPDASG